MFEVFKPMTLQEAETLFLRFSRLKGPISFVLDMITSRTSFGKRDLRSYSAFSLLHLEACWLVASEISLRPEEVVMDEAKKKKRGARRQRRRKARIGK